SRCRGLCSGEPAFGKAPPMPETPTAAARFDPETLAWDARGLLPAIAQDHASGEVLMLAWMTRESLAETLRTGQVTYWSRSRRMLWRKGETSGNVQRLVGLRIDCDRDCLLLCVD